MANETNNEHSATGSKLETIRELLFGQQVEMYDKQIDELRHQLQKQRTEMEEKMLLLHRQLFATIEALNSETTEALNMHKAHTAREIQRIDHEKTNRVELGKMLISLGNHLMEDGKARG